MPQKPKGNLKVAAYAYWKLGLNVVPLKFFKEGDWFQKKPIVKWKKWIEERQTLEEFNSLNFNCEGIAVVLGKVKSGLYLCCLDRDIKNLKTEEALKLGIAIFKELPETRTFSTVNNGVHAFYLSRERPKTDSKYHSTTGVELLGNGKLCVVYPSQGYEIINDPKEGFAQIENANKLLEEIVKKCSVETAKTWFGRPSTKKKMYKGPHPPCIEQLLKGVEEGERNEVGVRVASYLKNFRGLIRQTTLSRLNDWNAKNTPPLPENEILNTLKSVEEHHYIYGCNDPILKTHCKEDCGLFMKGHKEADLTLLQKIDRELSDSKKIYLHPLIDFHPELGYSLGLDMGGGEFLQIIDGKVVEVGDDSDNDFTMKKLSFSQISSGCKTGILKLAKDLSEGKEIENRSKEELFDLILSKIRYYWYHSDERWHIFATCLVFVTYYHRMFQALATWILQGVRKSGKTTMGQILRTLVWNPTELQSGVRSAPLFRGVEDSRPTYFIDVTQFNYKDPDLVDLLEIITPWGVVARCVGEQKDRIKLFHPFCPKVVAIRQSAAFSDKAIECVTEPSRKGSPYTERRIYIAKDPESKQFVEDLLRSAVCNWKEVHETYESLKQDKKLYGRRFELWSPLLSVCKVYSPKHYEDLLKLAYEDVEISETGDVTSDVEDALIGYLLKLAIEHEEKHSEMFLLKDLTAQLQDILSDRVVKTFHIVRSVIKNLGLSKKKVNTNRGVKYQIDFDRVRKLAEEKDIKVEIEEETEEDDDPNITKKFCCICGDAFKEGEEKSLWINGWAHDSCIKSQDSKITEYFKDKDTPKTFDSDEEFGEWLDRITKEDSN